MQAKASVTAIELVGVEDDELDLAAIGRPHAKRGAAAVDDGAERAEGRCRSDGAMGHDQEFCT